MLKNIEFIEVQPGTIIEDCHGDKRIYLGEFYLNIARLKINDNSISINEHIKDRKDEKGYVPSKRTIFYKIGQEMPYHRRNGLTVSYLQETDCFQDIFVNSGKIIGIDKRFVDINKNADEITLKNLSDQITEFQGVMSYISVSRNVNNLYDVYEKNINVFTKILKEKGKSKMRSLLKKSRMEFPLKRS